MIRSLNKIEGFKIGAVDGEIGKVVDFYFDELTWVVRYVIADTRRWLPGRKVLIDSSEIIAPNVEDGVLNVELSKNTIRKSPEVGFEETVSREKEKQLMDYFDWPVYWHRVSAPDKLPEDNIEPKTHLRSLNEVVGYDVYAKSDKIGLLEDILVEEPTWRIDYLVVKTENGNSREVLIAPFWKDSINWQGRRIDLNITKEFVYTSPEYEPEEDINPLIEKKLFEYYEENK